MVPLTQRVFGTTPLARSFDERIDRCRELPRVGRVRDAGLQVPITTAIHSFHLFAPKLSHGPWSGQTLPASEGPVPIGFTPSFERELRRVRLERSGVQSRSAESF